MSDQRFIVRESFYLKFIILLLSATAIMNQGFGTNPSQERTVKYTFLIAIIYHLFAVSLKNEKKHFLVDILFHTSGAIACEALMWFVIHDLSGFIFTNIHFLLVKVLPLCYNYISKVQPTSLSTEERPSELNDANPLEIISQGGSSAADQMPDMEAQEEGLTADQMPDLEAQMG